MKRLLYFTSPTCIPCKTFRPVVEKYREENPDIEVVIYDLNSDEQTFQNFGVRSVPTLILMDEIDRNVGSISEKDLIQFVERRS